MVLMISVHSLCLQSSANVLWLLNLQLGVPLTYFTREFPASFPKLSPAEPGECHSCTSENQAVNSKSRRAGQLEYLLGIAHVHRS